MSIRLMGDGSLIIMHDEGGATAVKVSGPVTLYESTEARDAFRAALADGRGLRIDLETSGPWDLSGLQVLISTVAAGRKAGLSVRLCQVPGVCRELAGRAGLEEWLAAVTESFQ